MKKIILLLTLFTIILTNAQSSWKKIDSENYASKGEIITRKNRIVKHDLYSLSTESFKNEVVRKNTTQQIIEIPNTNGKFSKFYIKESSNFTKPVNKSYGFIKSFSLQGIDDKTASGKISIGTDGVFVTIYSAKHSTFYIDPYTKNKSTYIAYERKNLHRAKSFGCSVKGSLQKKSNNKVARRGANDSKLRTYRLALACTDEYSQFHLSQQNIPTTASDTQKKAAVLSAMNTTITRVNGVYEREVAVKMNIVLNSNGENELIFLTADSNTLSNNSARSLINESQTTCDNTIGNANYDIGHMFSTGAGGLAGLGVVCISGSKAKGVTGRSNPINDGYDIDYVAHEIGHQFGAAHTFNNSCDGNRSDSQAVEPGSGSTIMAYAGICSPNVQRSSNDYFHSISIEQMWNTIQSNGNCATQNNTNNTAPTANAGNDFSVPKSTPLLLKGQGTDTNDATLTYCWEQIDNEIGTMPPLSTNTAGPVFRSLPPTESPNRYLPSLATVLAGNTSTEWEVLPSVAREMNFSLLVRDNHLGGGASARDDMKISVIDIDPFVITSQNSNVTWIAGSSQNITWNKSTTDQAPINCQNVRIKLSTDGGQTFPLVLVESTPNDGNHTITVPNNVTEKARILIEAVDNIFYNVNSTNFTIISSIPTFVLNNNTSLQAVCDNSTNTITYNLSAEFLNGFNETVTLSTKNLPLGTTASFSPATINTNGNIEMTLSNFNNANPQDYLITVIGTSSSVTQTVDANLKVHGSSFSNITLTQPSNGNTNVSIVPTLQWRTDVNVSRYIIEIAEDTNFNTIVETATSTTNSYTPTNTLKGITKYYWRVKPANNCAEGTFSDISTFTTETPSYCTSTFTDETGGHEHITNVTFNTINNNSGNDTVDGYQDFTSISTSVNPGKNYELKVAFDVAGFQDHCYVFIDWNQDFIFDNTTERYDLGNLFDPPKAPSAPGPVTRTISVPLGAVIGKTRMRVVIEYFGNKKPNGKGACDTDHKTEWGETEDYTINVKNPEPDFTLTNITGDASICNIAINQQDFIFSLNTIDGFNENTSFSVTGLPTNATSNFSTISLNTDGSTTLTLSNLNNVAVGDYNVTITATSASITKSTNFLLSVNDNVCKSYGNNNSQISITSVKFGDINNNSTKETTGYSDFKSIATEVIKGEEYNITTSVNTDGSNSVNTTAWIDWNQNCLFDDNEKYDLNTVNSITIPDDAKSGSTTLRISTKISTDGEPSSCELGFNGEVEDYTITIKPDFILTNRTNDASICNVAINQQDFIVNYKTLNDFIETVTFSTSGLPANATSNFNPSSLNADGNTTLTLSNLNNVAVGEYTVTVTATSNSVTKSTNFLLSVNDNVCKSYGNNNSQISITSVKFGDINNNSTKKTTGYSDFKSIDTKVIKGEKYNIKTSVNTDGNNSVNTTAWIDWNQNCLFDDNEKYDLNTVNSITIPDDAKSGSTTLRISTKISTDGEPSSCELGFNGEIEDYTIIVEESFATDATIFNDLEVYPIPSDGDLTVKFRVKTKDLITIKAYNTRGRLVSNQSFSTPSSLFDQKVFLTNLSSGLYFVEIINGGRNTYRKVLIK